MPHYSPYMGTGTGGRPLFTMDDHTQFLAAPPISSPPLIQPNPTSKLQYTSYGLQTHMHPSFLSNLRHSTRIPLPPRPSSTQYYAQAAESYDPQLFTFDPAQCSPCTHPSPKQHHPNSHPHFLLVPALIHPRSICSLALSTSPRTRMHSCTN